MKSNREIGKLLREIGAFLEMDGVAFKPRAYVKAAEAIEAMETPVRKLHEEGGIKGIATIEGVGKSIAEKIGEFLETGRVAYLEEMKAKRPVDLMNLVAIEGVGAKTVGVLYDALGITNLDELEKAAEKGEIRSLRGFGEKSEKEILGGIAFLRQHRGRFSLGEMLPLVVDIEERLRGLEGVRNVTIAGSIRRRKATVGDADLLVVANDAERVMSYLVSMPETVHVYGQGKTKTSIRLRNGLDVDCRVVAKESYGAALNYFTGSKAHNVHLRRIALSKGLKLNEYGLFDETGKPVAGRSERDLYEAFGLPVIPPELREDRGEIEAAFKGKLPRLIPYGKLKGDLQTQTSWSDGHHSVEEMAAAARDRGLEYIAITDHTKELAMMGLDETRLRQQIEEIRKIDRKMKGIRILTGAEVNILEDGALDIRDELLARLDVVGIAVHSHLRQSRAEMTARICRAMQHPQANILFHPTGRIVLKREPYAVDIEEVIRVAKKTGTLLEVDAIPDRLDLKDEHVRLAVDQGVKLVIDSDAHQTSHFDCLDLGVATARRGWATTRDVVNTLPYERFRKFLDKKSKTSR